MKSLTEYIQESILSSTSAGKSFILNKIKPIIDKIINSNSVFPMEWFLEGNNLRLEKDTVKKIVNKLKKVLPERALFGDTYGVPQIAKQNVEECDSVNYSYLLKKYAYYKIKIEYAYRPDFYEPSISVTEKSEYIIYLTDDYICALDIPETKSILYNLDEHFTKYTTQDEVKLTDTHKMKSKIGGKYRVYSFKDITKEFVERK